MKKLSQSPDLKSSELTELGNAPKANCTRVTSNIHGMKTSVTFREHEAEKLAQYVAQEEGKGAIVTSERGVWTV